MHRGWPGHCDDLRADLSLKLLFSWAFCLDFHRKSIFSSSLFDRSRGPEIKTRENHAVTLNEIRPGTRHNSCEKIALLRMQFTIPALGLLTNSSLMNRGFRLAPIRSLVIETAVCTCPLSNLSAQASMRSLKSQLILRPMVRAQNGSQRY